MSWTETSVEGGLHSRPVSAGGAVASGAGGLGGDHMEDMPVFGPGIGRTLLILFAELDDLEALQQRLHLGKVVEGHVTPVRPAVALPKEVPSEAATWSHRPGDLPPDGVEVLGMAKWQAQPGIEQVGGGQEHLREPDHLSP